jgi:hypothetical protein
MDALQACITGRASWLAVAFVLAVTSASVLAVPAFPGAEGYGAVAVGGRGGVVYEVTNLNDSGTGSLRAAVEASGPRTVVFRVSGTIILTKKLKISNPYITIAGQTAPGDGICLRKYPLSIDANEVVIRYIRVRFGNESGTADDAVSSRFIKNLILDHVSSSWSVDESMSVYHCQNVTIQWCMIAESLYAAGHPSGNHGFGGIWGSHNSTQHHNLIAHHTSRNPRFASGSGNTDYRNNVVYNWGYNSCYGGENQQVDNGVPNPLYAFSNINMVANYYKPGPATQSGVSHRIANPSYRDVKTDYGKWYIAENVMVGSSAVTADNWNGGVDPQGGSGDISLVKATTPFAVATTYPLTQQTATVACSYVLNNAGCSLVRDPVDSRIVTEVANGTATYGGTYGANTGIIDSEATVGGWPTLNSTTAPTDSDHDGMPDAWETANGLNPNDPVDRNDDRNGDGYTNLEEYTNSLCPDPYGADTTAPSPDPMIWAIEPAAASTSSIAMVAVTAADRSGVEYYFDCVAGGGHDSGWQDSTSYTDTGLTQGITYSYQVKARDKSANQNETGSSSVESASPVADTTAPIPNPMTWASVPAATGIDTITMTATTGIDASGVEYYFACAAGGGHDSGWQDSTSYTDTGLTNKTTYTYRVIARDKSAGQNETDWSAEASATTIRYTCSGPLETDFNADCKVDFMDYATLASQWGAGPGEPVNLVANGGFATDMSGWTLTANAPTTITPDNGTALLARNNATAASNGNYLYQIIPVVSGKQYKVSAQWKGDLLNGGTGRNWAEVYVGFGSSPTTFTGTIMYKKATDGGPNATPMPWGWESILLSPNTSPIGPSDGVFTATGSYMTIGFNIGGRAGVGPGYFYVDNISVVEVGSLPCPDIDLNGDCALNWLDTQVFAADWLACNRSPVSECWQ